MLTSRTPASSRTRSLQGCVTCRVRKMKCDEERPTCAACRRAKLQCEGYWARMRWIAYLPAQDSFESSEVRGVEKDEGGHGRRILYSDCERARMVSLTVEVVNRRGLNKVLQDIDTRHYSLNLNQHVFHGPFGVFTAFETATPGVVGGSESPQSLWFDPVDEEDGYPFNSCSDMPIFAHADDIESFVDIPASAAPKDQQINIADNYEAFDEDSSCLIDDLALGQTGEEEIQIIRNNTSHSFLGAPDLDHGYQIPLSSFWQIPSPTSLNLPFANGLHTNDTVPLNAHFLLDHYKAQMIKLFSPLRVRKPPWSVLHLPIALSTLSELSLWGKTSHAKHSLFYALLAVSAFNLDRIQLGLPSTSNFWWAVGEAYREMAKQEMQRCLAKELQGLQKSKYKEILMALTTMVTISVVSGQHKDARSYLLDAEQLICIRGIPKAVKSRKVRILHNIYLFLRVIEESTFIYSNSSSCVQHWSSQPAGERREYQFPSLRTHCARLGKDLDDISSGCFETGLISQLENESPLFMEIYGIPTSLLSLLSKVTSLANKIDAHATPSNNANVPMAFAAESKILENQVCNWELGEHVPEEGAGEAADANFPASRSIVRHIILAIHNGVVMYFYRRIYNLNPMILQSYVDKTLEHLLQCEQEKLRNNIVNCGIVWPGFIAAAEAIGDARQRRILGWLRDNAASSGLRNFDAAGDVVEELWRIRRTRPDVTWVDMLREKGTTLVLT